MAFTVDWEKHLKSFIDLGSESYETKATRMALKIGAVVLFLIVVWKVLK
jgi:hypothetical protein